MLLQRVQEIPSCDLTVISTVLVSSWLLQGCWQERNNQPLLPELQQGQTKCLHISSSSGIILQLYEESCTPRIMLKLKNTRLHSIIGFTQLTVS